MWRGKEAVGEARRAQHLDGSHTAVFRTLGGKTAAPLGEHAESCGASLGAQTVKNPPAVRETGARSLGREEPLEKEMATHSSILAWRILWTEEPGGLQSVGLQRVGHD